MHSQRLVDFINDSPWSPNAVLQYAVMMVLRGLGWRVGKPLSFIFDGTKFRKRGKKMEGAYWFHDTKIGKAAWGHEVVVLCVRFKGVTLPWAIRIYLPKEYVLNIHGEDWGKYYLTTNEIAAQIIDGLPHRFFAGGKALALFDSGFFNEEVLAACRRRKLRFISVSQVTRVFHPDHKCGRPAGRGEKKKENNKRVIGSYGPGVLRYQGDEIELPSYRGTTRYRVAERVGVMSRVGRVKVVFSRRLTDDGHIALVTDDVTMSASEVIQRYRERWSIEVFFKTVKQNLGFGDYRTRRLQGVERHLHLGAIAYLLLRHLGLCSSGEPTPMRDGSAIHSTEALQAKLRADIAQDHVNAVLNRHGPVPAIQSLVGRMTGVEIPET